MNALARFLSYTRQELEAYEENVGEFPHSMPRSHQRLRERGRIEGMLTALRFLVFHDAGLIHIRKALRDGLGDREVASEAQVLSDLYRMTFREILRRGDENLRLAQLVLDTDPEGHRAAVSIAQSIVDAHAAADAEVARIAEAMEREEAEATDE